MKTLILLMVILTTNACLSQEVLRVYFEYGKSQPKEGEKARFDQWFEQFDLMSIDSIVLVGFADSTGKLENNLKLSIKRAENIRMWIKNDGSESFPIKVIGRGEKKKKIEEKDRRVEVSVWVNKMDADSGSLKTETDSNQENAPCYLVDYEFLQHCFVDYVTIKNVSYAKLYIETKDFNRRKKVKYFYYTQESGKNKLNRVKWMKKESGIDWYQRSRYEALIPEKSFLKNKIVYHEPKSCDSCFKDSLFAISNDQSVCYTVDWFISQNHQYKIGFLNFKSVKVRIPAMFFDSSIVYYDGFSRQRLTWFTKKRKPNYKYTKLRISNFNFSSITKELPCCGTRSYNGGRCGKFPTDKRNAIVMEIGNNRLANLNHFYAGMGYFYNGDAINCSILGTVDQKMNPGYRANFKVNFLSVPIQFLSPIQIWRNGSRLNVIGNGKDFEIGIGTELRQRFQDKYMEADLYSSLNYNLGRFKLFFNAGAGYRFSGVYEKQWRRLIQFGTIFRLYEFKRLL